MRGKAATLQGYQEAAGITPAYAGKRLALQAFDFGKWDHPRLCGEKITSLDLTATPVGSPPPMRGKGTSRHCCILPPGITPAYAGKS